MQLLSLLLIVNTFTFAYMQSDDIRAPKVFRGLAVMPNLERRIIKDVQRFPPTYLRQRDWSTPDLNKHKKCGPGIGYCNSGDCCSAGGNCGQGYHYCSSPSCQLNYSNGCDASVRPLGDPTLDIRRPLIGNVSYDGAGIDHCKNSGAIALTFDDGPFNYTAHLLDVLAAHGAKATFFITGNNLGKGQIDIEETGWPDVIRRMHADGHQIAAHSWTHQNFSLLNETEIVNQVHYLEMALRNVLGFFPTYMRPPYTECQEQCQIILKRMGYHITYQNIVDFDWADDSETKIQHAKDTFTLAMEQTTPRDVDYIILNHDTHYQSAWNLSNYILDYLNLFNFSNSVTVGECMGDPPENWYRTASGAPNHNDLLGQKSQSSIFKSSIVLLLCGYLVANIWLW